MLIHSPSGGIMLSQDEYNLHGVEADIGSKGVARISNSGIDGIGSLSRTISSSELSKQGNQAHCFMVYQILLKSIASWEVSLIQTHKAMCRSSRRWILSTLKLLFLLMRNLTINLSSPDFEPIREVLSSYDVNSKTVGIATGNVMKNQEK